MARANSTDYGLAAGIFSSDLERVHRVAAQLQCGTVWVNGYNSSRASAPFGGIKRSGIGKEGGLECVDDYSQVKPRND